MPAGGSRAPTVSIEFNQQQRVDFDLHGVVGIRLVDPTPGDIAAVRRQVGPFQGPLRRKPDITLRFVKQLAASSVRYLGLGKKAFNDQEFFVFEEDCKTKV